MLAMQNKTTTAIPEPAICNCLALRQAARQATQLYDRHLSVVGLRTTQYSIMAKLSRLGPQTINELAGQMVMDRTTMGRAILPLQREKLVEIDAGADARTRIVRLTPAGETRLKAAASHWKDAQKQFETAYGTAESARLRTTLAEVVAAL
jgi:DNA-binding MarR family transcriptional regulator